MKNKETENTDTEILVRYQEETTKKADGTVTRLRKLPKGIKASVNSLGIEESTGFITLYSAPTTDLAVKFFKLFFATSDIVKGDKNNYYPYVLEQKGVTHLLVSVETFNLVYKAKMHNILNVVLKYTKFDTVKKSIFTLYTYFVYTWKSHYYKDKVLKTIDIDELHRAVLHYSQPEKLNIVDTRGKEDEEDTEEKKDKREPLRLKSYEAQERARKAREAKKRQKA